MGNSAPQIPKITTAVQKYLINVISPSFVKHKPEREETVN